ncbi:FN3 associated domain-containing protein [Candidatus Neomarinimicrobiota bacterium]
MNQSLIFTFLFPALLFTQVDIERSSKPEYSHTRGFYSEPFYLTLTAASEEAQIRYTTDNTKPDENDGIPYTGPIRISEMTTIRAVAFEAGLECSDVRTHSFIFFSDVLTQDDGELPTSEYSGDHVFWTEEFDMHDATDSEEEMIEALLDIPTMFISAPYDSIFGVAGIHRGQNLEEYGGDPHHPDWIELVECSVEMIYPENYRDGRFKSWQENCGIKIQGGAGRWQNGYFDHKQSFTLKFRNAYGEGLLDHDFLETAPFNSHLSPKKFDKIIIRTGFNRDWGSDWDRANCAYTRDQFGRDLQTLMSGWGNKGTYAHLYINGKYWGQYNPCERMDDHAMATYFGGEDEDYFFGKGKGGPQSGNPDRYYYLNNTDWTNVQLSEIGKYLAVDTYIDLALVHCYSNAGDSPQYYFGCRTNPPGPMYFTGWDMEDSFDGGARRSGPPVSLENYEMPYSNDKFDAYFKLKKNIDFKMKFSDRVYKHCFNNGILTDSQVVAIWDSSCRIIEKSILGEIARWGDERGEPYGYDHWLSEIDDVRRDLIGRSDLLVTELRKSGMFPFFEPVAFMAGDDVITTDSYNCDENFELTLEFLLPGADKIIYTTDGSDPRKWDLTGEVSDAATIFTGRSTSIPISQMTTVKVRSRNGLVWSPLQEIKIILKESSSVVITEINYDSAVRHDTEDWVELYNNSDRDISLAGWTIKDSNDDNVFQFGNRDMLWRRSLLVVCNDTAKFAELTDGVKYYTGNMNFKFSNEGDAVRVFDNNNVLVDSVMFDDEAPWPIQAAGWGNTLELINPAYDNSQPENWSALSLFGSPGLANNDSVVVDTTHRELPQIPVIYKLSQNYPNPFNLTTHIDFDLADACAVTLKIYNILGQEIATLVDDYQEAGSYSVRWSASGLASGIYFYQLKTKTFSATKKLAVIK